MAKNSYPSKENKQLFQAILKLKSNKEAEKFFRDLLTLPEIEEFSKRWQIVLLLNQGLPYAEIAEKLGTSTSTVTRVAGWLNHGAGGYQLALKRFLKDKNS